MQPIACITGADRGLGFALCTALLQQEWQVFAGQFMPDWPDLTQLATQHPETLHIIPLDVSSIESAHSAAQKIGNLVDRIDLFINNAGVISDTTQRQITEAQDYAEFHRLYDINALGPLRMVEACLPFIKPSAMKRLCFVSSEAGSIARSERISWYSYCMSKTALNMGVKILFNHLRPEGYTFRLYHPGWIRSYMGGSKNMEADLEPSEAAEYALAYFLGDVDDEDRLVLRDYKGEEWAW
jgi:NAD(P)-dependent dehydrogenase (short-subunit alcohol dehydrogenase family)